MKNIAYHHYGKHGINLVVSRNSHTLSYPRHIHTQHWTLGLLIRGKTELTTRHGACLFHPGQHFIVAPHEPHSLIVHGDSIYIALCVEHDKLIAASPKDFNKLIRAASLAAGLSPSQQTRLFSLTKIMRLKAHSIEKHPENPANELAQTLANTPEQVFSIKEMADRLQLSPWHFVRHFQRKTGMTPHAMQIACRISKARRLLQNKTAIAEAASAAGFADQSHMHKTFKRHHGLTPREFVKATLTPELP